jgi:hypothetical protein
MSVKSFTNEPGAHFQSEFRTNTTKGRYLSQTLDTQQTFAVRTGFSNKSQLVHGNRIASTPYMREVRAVTTDQPSKHRFVWRDGDTIHADYVEKRYLSGDVPTMFMSEPGQFWADMDTARNEVVTRARAALRDQTSVDNGANLAEARQTVNMIAQNSITFWTAYQAGRRGDWAGVSRALGIDNIKHKPGTPYANTWLGIIYGWRPLLSSIKENYDVMKATDPESLYLEVRKTRKVKLAISQDAAGLSSIWECDGGVTCGLKARIDNAFFRSGDQLGLVNPLAVGWEVVPYSFVVDWFIPVGTMLQSLSATSGLTFLDGFVSMRSSNAFTARRSGLYDDPGKIVIRNFKLTRDVLSGFPLPGIYMKKNPFSTIHVANALALWLGNYR